MSFFRFLFLFILFSLGAVHQLLAQDLYDLEHSRTFAKGLMEQEAYEHAVQEYERVIHLAPEVPSYRCELLSAYEEAGFYRRGLERAKQLFEDPMSVPRPTARNYAKLLYGAEAFDPLRKYVERNEHFFQRDRFSTTLTVHMIQREWEKAYTFFEDRSPIPGSFYSKYAELVKDAKSRPRRSPFAAVAFSSILPGSGKFYTGNWKDGLVSLLLTGFNGYMAYRGFRRKGVQSVQGWIFSGLGFSFYIGNLYGAAKGAERFNQRQEQKLVDRAKSLWRTRF
ncbi:MAG: hypothetical protein ABEH38_07435 [Flavobacteriales bacterium]